MKFALVSSAFVAGALAQGLSPGGSAVSSALAAISSATSNLDSDISAYSGSSSTELENARDEVLSAIRDGESSVSAAPMLETSDASIATSVQSLATLVQKTVDDTVSKKSVFDANNVGYLILQALQSISSATSSFISTTNAKLPALLAGAASSLESPITDALSSGVAAYADETSAATGGSSATATSGGSSSATATSEPATTEAPTYSPSLITATSVAASPTAGPIYTVTGTGTLIPVYNATASSTLAPFTGAAPTAAAAYGAAVLAAVGGVLAAL